MKIDHTYIPTPASGLSAPAKRAAPSTEESPSKADDVTLSDAARLAAAETSAPIDFARIAEIKNAIANGQFKINSGAIADRLLDSARDLLAPKTAS